MIALTLFTISLSANAIVLRGTHKVCGNGAELTLYSSGRMVFWDENMKADIQLKMGIWSYWTRMEAKYTLVNTIMMQAKENCFGLT